MRFISGIIFTTIGIHALCTQSYLAAGSYMVLGLVLVIVYGVKIVKS